MAGDDSNFMQQKARNICKFVAAHDSTNPHFGDTLWPYSDTFHNGDNLYDVADSFNYIVYPNPFSDDLSIEVENNNDAFVTDYKIIIFKSDFTTIVEEDHTTGNNTTDRWDFDTETWPSGTYYIHVLGNNFNYHKSNQIIKP